MKQLSDKGHRAKGIAVVFFPIYCLLLTVYCLFLTSCAAPKKVEIPTYEGVDIRNVLSEKENIKSIRSTFYIELEKDGGALKGDAALRLTPDSLDLQVYSLGFLVAEVTSNNDATTSNPPIEGNRLSMLVEGIRSSFFWWSIKNPDIRDDHDLYRISNSWRRVFVNKKTMMPEKQFIDLEDGGELRVYYGEPTLMESGVWFPSQMRIELNRRSVKITVKTLSVNPL